MEPNCWCGRAAVLKTSWTDANLGRRFWGCFCFMEDRRNSCNFHFWFDPPMCQRSRMIIPGLLKKIDKLEDDLGKHEAAVEKKGNKKSPILYYVVMILLVWVFIVLNKEMESMPKGYELPK
ncbi:uncharacterized protein LOC141714718 [Apium graveolens]|uniref:uncharacterized protein LOC141714718 n=1 Tax=Apium graveolens TaxID=4045 RepID=UPI003D7AAE64